MDADRRSRAFPLRGRLALLAAVVVADLVLVRAHQAQPRVNVVTVAPQSVGPHVGGGRGSVAPVASGSGAAGPITDGSCPATAPDATWTCRNGTWTPPSGVGMGTPRPSSGAAASEGIAPVTSTPVTAVPPATGVAASETPPSAQAPATVQQPATTAPAGAACPGQAPSIAWTCRNGVWMPGSGGGGEQ